MKRLIAAFGAALLSLSLLAQAAWAAGLAERVAAALKERAPQFEVEITGPDDLVLHGSEYDLLMSLRNLRAYCEADPGGCDQEIAVFADTAVAKATTPDSQPSADRFLPVLRQEGYLPPGLMVQEAFVPGLVVAYVVDSPTAVQFIKTLDLEDYGLTERDLKALARRNAANLPPADFGTVEELPLIWELVADDGVTDARLFDPDAMDELERQIGGPLAFAVPAHDWVLAARLDDAEAVSQLREAAAYIAGNVPNPISPVVFQRDGQGWALVEDSSTGAAEAQEPI